MGSAIAVHWGLLWALAGVVMERVSRGGRQVTRGVWGPRLVLALGCSCGLCDRFPIKVS